MTTMSKESAQRSQDLEYDPTTVHDPNTQQAITSTPSLRMPSETVEPTRIDTPQQQASTGPDDGNRVHFPEKHLEEIKDQTTMERREKDVPFKEQVIGYAQKTRGTLLGKPDLKEHGEQILEGLTTHEQDRAHHN